MWAKLSCSFFLFPVKNMIKSYPYIHSMIPKLFTWRGSSIVEEMEICNLLEHIRSLYVSSAAAKQEIN